MECARADGIFKESGRLTLKPRRGTDGRTHGGQVFCSKATRVNGSGMPGGNRIAGVSYNTERLGEISDHSHLFNSNRGCNGLGGRQGHRAVSKICQVRITHICVLVGRLTTLEKFLVLFINEVTQCRNTLNISATNERCPRRHPTPNALDQSVGRSLVIIFGPQAACFRLCPPAPAVAFAAPRWNLCALNWRLMSNDQMTVCGNGFWDRCKPAAPSA